jgi:peroxiredoxin
MTTPDVGEPAPAFTLPTQRGVPVRLSDVLARGHAVLIAFIGRVDSASPRVSINVRDRGSDRANAGIATAVDRRLIALARVHARLRERDLQLLVIVPNRQDDAKRYVEETGTPFPLLCDDGAVATQYGVRRRLTLRRDTRPALFVVNGEGRIGFRLLDTWDDQSPAFAEAIASVTVSPGAGSGAAR